MSLSLLNASEAANAIGLGLKAFLRLYRAGAFPAAVHEGRLMRFEIQAVRDSLAKRARKHRDQRPQPHTTTIPCDHTVCL